MVRRPVANSRSLARHPALHPCGDASAHSSGRSSGELRSHSRPAHSDGSAPQDSGTDETARNTIVFENEESLQTQLFKLFSTNHSPNSSAASLHDLLCCLPRIETALPIDCRNVFRVLSLSTYDLFYRDDLESTVLQPLRRERERRSFNRNGPISCGLLRTEDGERRSSSRKSRSQRQCVQWLRHGMPDPAWLSPVRVIRVAELASIRVSDNGPLVWVGHTQWIGIIPLILQQRGKGRSKVVQDLLITGFIGLLLSSACATMMLR